MRLLSGFDKALDLLQNPKDYGTSIIKIADKVGKNRQTLYFYRKHPEKIPLDVINNLAQVYDECNKNQRELLAMLTDVKTERENFEDTQSEITDLIRNGMAIGKYTGYTKRVAKTLIMELSQNNSDLLHLLIDRMKGWNI